MLRKMMFWAVSFMMMMNLTGCFLLVAGVAGGAGTAIWLSGKLTQEFHYPYQNTIEATKLALKSLNLEVVKETREEKVTQIKSKYSDGKEMWIDINKVGEC